MSAFSEANLSCFTTTLAVPEEYEPTIVGSMNLFIRRMVPANTPMSSIKRVIIGISGGPGSSMSAFEGIVLSRWKKNNIMKDSIFISADHRFTGKSNGYFCGF